MDRLRGCELKELHDSVELDSLLLGNYLGKIRVQNKDNTQKLFQADST